MSRNISELVKELKNPQNIIITTHRNPDGDAMGSSLGLYHALVREGHQVNLIAPTDYPNFLKWLPGDNIVLKWTNESQKKQIEQLVEDANYVFCLDFNDLSRIDDLGSLVEKSKAKKVMIDHHLDPKDFDDFRLHAVTACSTAELVYVFLSEHLKMGDIGKDIATCLYTGILTDSGSFRFPSTTSNVHRITADLLDQGANNTEIYEAIYDNFKEKRLRLLGHCLNQRLRFIMEGKVAIMHLYIRDHQEFKIESGDTEGMVNYPLSVEGTKVSVFVSEYEDIVKISFRSKGDFPVNELASKYFYGGGHKNAAGGKGEETADLTIAKIEKCIKEYEEYL